MAPIPATYHCWECPIVSHHWFFCIYHHSLSVRRDRSEPSPFQPGAFPPLACLISKGFPSVIAGVVSIPFVPARADTDVHLFGHISTHPENLKSGSSPDRDVTHSRSLTATSACHSTLPFNPLRPIPCVVHIPTAEYPHNAPVTVSLFIRCIWYAPLPLYTPQVPLVVIMRWRLIGRYLAFMPSVIAPHPPPFSFYRGRGILIAGLVRSAFCGSHILYRVCTSLITLQFRPLHIASMCKCSWQCPSWTWGKE